MAQCVCVDMLKKRNVLIRCFIDSALVCVRIAFLNAVKSHQVAQ